jgi:replicative DNA helicase
MSDVAEKEPEAAEEATFEFDEKFQTKIAALALRDPVFVQRTEGLIEPTYFENEIDAVLVKITQDHFRTYKQAPDPATLVRVIKQAKDDKKIPKDMWPDIKPRLGALLGTSLSNRDYAIDQVADFAKHKAMEGAIMSSVGLLAKGDYSKIEQLIKAAVNVGAVTGSGEYDYFTEIEARTKHRNALATGLIKPDGITTGLPEIDKHLYHGGWGRKELSAIMGRAKFGKSMALGDFGKGAAMAGYKVFIATCEVSCRIYADRMDANFADTAMNALTGSAFAVEAKIKAAEARAKAAGGVIKMEEYSSGRLKPSQLRRRLEWYRDQGIIFDLIIVDYADIMCPERLTGEIREDSRSIWIDLRDVAFEQNAAVLTATQTNREGAKATVAKGTDVAEDYNKTRIADLLLSGNATDPEISAGECRLHFAASRNQKEVTLRLQQKREQMKFATKVLGIL